MLIYGYGIGVWLVLRQGRRGMARAKARVQGYGYVVGLWCRGMARAKARVQGCGYVVGLWSRGMVHGYGYG